MKNAGIMKKKEFRFKVGPKKVGFGNQRTAYVARPYYASKIDKHSLYESIMDSSGIKKDKVVGVVDALITQFEQLMMNGHTIHLEDFGSFKISFDSASKETPDGFTDKDIKNPRIIFIPDIRLRKKIKESLFFTEMKDGDDSNEMSDEDEG